MNRIYIIFLQKKNEDENHLHLKLSDMHQNLKTLSKIYRQKLLSKDLYLVSEFSVPQIEYPLGGSGNKGSHLYFLLIVAIVLL